jgi:hypothetical protein
MSERLDKALEFANYRLTLNNQFKRVKVRAEGMLIYAKSGGSFTIDQSLICFVDYLVRSNMKEATLLDDNKNPIHIEDIQLFLKEITSRYFEVTNDYLKEYQTIRKSRNVRSILDLKDEE